MIPWSLITAHIFSDKRRTLLTVVGIIIAVFSVYSLLVLGAGFEAGLLSQFEDIGLSTILVQTRSSGFGAQASDIEGLGEDDFEEIERARGVKEATYMILRPQEVSWKDTTIFPSVVGIPLDKDIDLAYSFFSLELAEGRKLGSNDRKRVTIGPHYTDSDAFDDTLQRRSSVSVGDTSYRVVGIHESLGNQGDDSLIIGDADTLFPDEDFTFIIVEPLGDVESAMTEIEETLRRHRNEEEGEETFTVQRVSDFVSDFLDIIEAFQLVVVVVAGVSLIVGGVGIVNTMRMAILQRQSTIGIMKSVGATKRTVFLTFLIEALLLGFLGGLIGLLLAIGATELLEYVLAQSMSIQLLIVSHPTYLISVFLTGTTLLGGVAGAYPAWRAATLDPVVALRAE